MNQIQYDPEGRLNIFSLFGGGRDEFLQKIANQLEVEKDLVAKLSDVKIQKLAIQRGLSIEQVVPYPPLTEEIQTLLRLEMSKHDLGAKHRTGFPGKPEIGFDPLPSQREVEVYAFFRLCDSLNNSRD